MARFDWLPKPKAGRQEATLPADSAGARVIAVKFTPPAEPPVGLRAPSQLPAPTLKSNTPLNGPVCPFLLTVWISSSV